jgi:cell division protein FtsZ
MSGAGSALMGIGHGTGADRAEEAAKAAISSPLLESSIDGAKGVLLSIAGPTDLTLHEVNTAADTITRVAHPDANIIFGAVVDDALGEEVRVTVVAAGFDKLAAAAPAQSQVEGRLARLLEEPEPVRPLSPTPGQRKQTKQTKRREEPIPVPSILEDDEEDVFRSEPSESVAFDAEEDLDIPDFLKS